MFTLQNSHLTVSILDPFHDREYLGSRYCTGGYIYQIRDSSGNDLLSGPRFGESIFSVFDGQGAPEVFVTALGEDTAEVGDEVLVIGVGRVKRTSAIVPFHVRNNPVVSEFAAWDIDLSNNCVVMNTEHCFKGWRMTLTRTVNLRDRTVESVTRLENIGETNVPVRWFAHPFFPLAKSRETCAFSLPFAMPENPGYAMNSNGFIIMNDDYQWEKGLFLKLGLGRDRGRLTVRQRHPVAEEIRIECGFTPGDLGK